MATVYPTVTGDYSTRTWNDDATGAAYGMAPQVGDTVLLNNLTITVDQDLPAITIRNIAGTTAAAGGSLTLVSSRTIAATLLAGASVLCSYTSGSCTFSGDITGGSASNCHGVSIGGTVTATFSGTITGGTFSNARGVSVQGASNVINFTGSLVPATSQAVLVTTGLAIWTIPGGSYTAIDSSVGAINITSAGIARIIGNVTGGSTTGDIAIQCSGRIYLEGNATGGTASGADAVLLSLNGSLYVLGNVIGGSVSNARGIDCSPGISILVVGNVTAGVAGNAINIAMAELSDICVVYGNVTGGATSGIGINNTGAGGTVKIFGTATNSGGNATANTGGGTVEVIAVGGGGASFPLIGGGGLIY